MHRKIVVGALVVLTGYLLVAYAFEQAVGSDQRVGLSHTTGQITHHISPDVDWVDGFHSELEGKNGGGDPWRTDGRLAVGVIRLE